MRLLTRQGYLVEEEGMTACTYRIALGPRAGQKVLSFQTVPTQAVQPTSQRCVNEHGFSLHAEVCCTAQQRKKLESQAQGCCLLGAPRTQHCAATSPAPPSSMND